MTRVAHRNFHFQQGHFYSLKPHQDDLRRILEVLKEKNQKKNFQKKVMDISFLAILGHFCKFCIFETFFWLSGATNARVLHENHTKYSLPVIVDILEKKLKNVEIT